jgi:hypothetical protein
MLLRRQERRDHRTRDLKKAVRQLTCFDRGRLGALQLWHFLWRERQQARFEEDKPVLKRPTHLQNHTTTDKTSKTL